MTGPDRGPQSLPRERESLLGGGAAGRHRAARPERAGHGRRLGEVAAFYFSINLGANGINTFPEDNEFRRALAIVTEL